MTARFRPARGGRISAGAPVGGITDPNLVAGAIEVEASDAGNQAKLREPAGAPRRNLFVVFDPLIWGVSTTWPAPS